MTEVIDQGGGFRATGEGFHNAVPNVPANDRTGNGLLINQGLAAGVRNQKLWLYVVGVATAWSVAGTYGQAQQARRFYPQHLQQDELVLSLAFPNQYERDRLVEFVSKHHQTAIGRKAQVNRAIDDGGYPVTFKLVPYYDQNETHLRSPGVEVHAGKELGKKLRVQLVPPMNVDGYITAAEAGAERFMFAPTLDIRMKVTEDHNQQPWQSAVISNHLLNDFLSRFGKLYNRPDFIESETETTTHGLISEGEDLISGLVGAVAGGLDMIVGAAANPAEAIDDAWNALQKAGRDILGGLRNPDGSTQDPG